MENNDYVLIDLDKTRRLRISYKALKTYKAKFNKSITNMDASGFDMEDVAKIIYVGLIHEDQELTLEKVEDMIDKVSLQYVIGKMQDALEAAFSKNVMGTV